MRLSSRVQSFMSMRLWIVAIAAAAVAILGLAVHALPSAGASPQASVRKAPSATATVDIIAVNPFTFAFSPTMMLIPAGTTVQWVNNTIHTHTSTSNITGTLTSWDAVILPATSFTLTFDTPGTYMYHCAIHTYMMGSIVVIAPRIFLPLVVYNQTG